MVAGAQDGLDNFSVSESSQNGVSVGLCLTYANDSAMKKEATKWQKERDAWWQDVILEYSTKCDVEWVDAEDPLFLLYTSGSTGKPKGVVHTTGGYMEKQKLKVKEKLDKYHKEKLLEFCDLFDMPIAKTSAKKEDVVVKLIDFMLTPHATTSELISEKEQSSKGKKRTAKRFSTDLTSRKASIKLMIQEELTKLADEADEEDKEEAVEGGVKA